MEYFMSSTESGSNADTLATKNPLATSSETRAKYVDFSNWTPESLMSTTGNIKDCLVTTRFYCFLRHFRDG